jgi:AraC-like DNA-binding protein
VRRIVGYALNAESDVAHVGPPVAGGRLTVVLEDGATVDGLSPGRVLVTRPHRGPLSFSVETCGGGQVGVHVELSPVAVGRLTASAPGAWRGPVADLGVLRPEVAGELLGVLAGPGSLADRTVTIGASLHAWIDRPGWSPSEQRLDQAWQLLASGARVGGVVEQAARGVGWSPRYLHARFVMTLGCSPSDAVHLSRLERAGALMASDEAMSLAAIATEVGYSDQSHLSRLWRAATGTTPAAWRNPDQFRFVQDRS